MDGATIYCTRLSYGTQIRRALDDLVRRGIIVGWEIETEELGQIRYALEDERMFAYYPPGKCAAMLNELGYDIRFGKAPTICVECGDELTTAEERLVRSDTDFVEHGNPAHLIRTAAAS